MLEAVRDDNALPFDIDLIHIATEKVHPPDHFSDGINDVRQVEIARCDFVQHWREQEKILAIDQCDIETLIVAFLELQRGIKTTKAAAENENRCLLFTHA